MIRKHLLRNAAPAQTTETGGTAKIPVTVPPSRTPPPEVLKREFKIESDEEESDMLGADTSRIVHDTKTVRNTPAAPPVEEVKKEAAKIAEEPPKKVEQPKTEEKKVEEPPKKEEKKEDIKPSGPDLLGLNKAKQTAEKKEIKQRDLTGYPENEAKLLQQMSNEAFEYVAPILKAQREKQTANNGVIFQHPNAYVLHPDFQRVQTEAAYAKAESSAWNEQLMNIRAGKKWTPLTGVDEKTGKFIYGAEREPSLQDEEVVRAALYKCQQVEQQNVAALQSMPQQFQSIVNNDNVAINTERAKRFDWVANPELLKHELELVNGDGSVTKKTIGDIRNDFNSILPPYWRGTIMAEVGADLFAAVNALAVRLRAAEAGKQVAETLKEEAKHVQPTGAGLTAGRRPEPKYGVTEFNLDGLPD